MFLPIGDTPNPVGFKPWVNWSLIAANVAVYLFISLPLSTQGADLADPALRELLRNLPAGVHVTAYDLFTYNHGYKPGAPELTDMLNAMFLHGGFMHLAGNMLFLWIYGDNIEHRLGRLNYFMVYILTGAAATWTFALFAGDSMVPLVGASGAISGVLGCYFIFFPRNKVKVFVVLFPFFMNVILLPSRWVLGAFVIIDNVFPIVIGAKSGVAYGAHLGGFMAGLAVAWAVERASLHVPSRSREKAAVGEAPEVVPTGPLEDAIARRDRPGALAIARGQSPVELVNANPQAALVIAEWLADAGEPVAATELLRRILGLRAPITDQARVYLTLGLIRLEQGQPTAAYQHLMGVFDFDPDEETAERARAALSKIDVYRRRN